MRPWTERLIVAYWLNAGKIHSLDKTKLQNKKDKQFRSEMQY